MAGSPIPCEFDPGVLYRLLLMHVTCRMQAEHANLQTSACLQGTPEEALDVLRQGLAMQPSSSQGVQTGRLLLTMAEVELNRSSWVGLQCPSHP